MFLALALLALQEPAPLPDSNPQGETVTMQEVQAKLAEVTNKFADADARLREAVRQFDDLSLAETVSSEAQPLLLQEAAKASRDLVAEMNALLELLPAPPPGQGQGQGHSESPGEGQGEGQKDSSEDSENKDFDGNKPSQGSPKPSQQEGNQGQSSLLDQPLSDFLRNPRDGQWGKLPPRLQQAIDNASAENVPLRYRRWLVEYHRQDQAESDNQ
ncbi:MAG: hypothetical protein O3A95_05005 [Planctomycetota bacterium]|nr:hypothetical protein [Planctomycetota bacterium]MDA1113643.1 hypothetical protein [Planctomycetota bacterium]